LAFARYKDICRLDIAMDDAFLMCCIQPIHNLNGEIEQFTEVQRLFSRTYSSD